MEEERRQSLFREVVEQHGRALARLCGGYERDSARRLDLEQEILLNIWRALPTFRAEASLRTWMYRVAHNVATRHVTKAAREPITQQDPPPEQPGEQHVDHDVDRGRARNKLRALVAELRPLDRQIILLYFEDVPQKEIAEVTGLSQANVSTRVHRIKAVLTDRMSP